MSGAFVKVSKIYVEPNTERFLGTNVNIGVILDDISSATSTIITIDNPYEVAHVEDAAMTQIEDYVYEYTFQSLETYTEGTYLATITITNGSYSFVHQVEFEMKEQS